MKRVLKDQKGLVIVEAVYVFPIMLLITIAMYFLAMFTASKVSLQSSLEWCMNHLANDISDASVVQLADDRVTINDKLLNPYRHLFTELTEKEKAEFNNSVKRTAGWWSLPMGGEIQVKIEEVNWVLYKELKASAVDNIKMPINMSFVGLPSEVRVEASVKRMVCDRDEFTRNVDIAFDVAEAVDDKYDISGKVGGMIGKAKGFIAKLFK